MADKELNYRHLFYGIIDTVVIIKIYERFSNLHNLKCVALLDFEKCIHYKEYSPITLIITKDKLKITLMYLNSYQVNLLISLS